MTRRPSAPRRASRRGVALFTTVVTLVSVVLMVAGLFVVSDLQFKAERNRSDAARALMLAEAALTHGTALLKGSLSATTFNALLAAGGVAEIPAAGVALSGGKYFLSIRDDPADPSPGDATDSNNNIMLVCTGRTHAGSEVTINQVVSRTGVFRGAMAVDGPMEISGKPRFTGSCGSVHVNGPLQGGGEPFANQGWSTSTGSAIPTKFQGTKTTKAPQALIPVISAATKFPAGCTTIAGTEIEASTLVSGRTYCRTGNLELKGDMTAARTVSIVATGSIKIAGKPRLKAQHPEGYVILAGGDIDIGSEAELQGTLYCGGKIQIGGKAKITGNIICRAASHTGASLASKTLISGDAEITAVCSKIPTIGEGTPLRAIAQFDSIWR